MAKDFYQGSSAPGGRSFNDQENRCKQVFQEAAARYGGFWHLCTPGEDQPLIFRKREDYVFMMTAIAICAYAFPSVKVITFEIMGNHLHMMLCGYPDELFSFFAMLKKKLRRYLSIQGEGVCLDGFACKRLIPAETLESLRNQIAYINRNNYLVDPDHTPFSYPYGANGYYFLPSARRFAEGRFGDLTLLERRSFVHARDIGYPDDWIIIGGAFSPVNYVHFDIGEGVFRNARHYFHKITREIESYKEIAAQLGDAVFYTDDELSAVIYRICKREYDVESPMLLTANSKFDLARRLHYDYNADNGKIARLVKLSRNVLDQMFLSKDSIQKSNRVSG